MDHHTRTTSAVGLACILALSACGSGSPTRPGASASVAASTSSSPNPSATTSPSTLGPRAAAGPNLQIQAAFNAASAIGKREHLTEDAQVERRLIARARARAMDACVDVHLPATSASTPEAAYAAGRSSAPPLQVSLRGIHRGSDAAADRRAYIAKLKECIQSAAETDLLAGIGLPPGDPRVQSAQVGVLAIPQADAGWSVILHLHAKSDITIRGDFALVIEGENEYFLVVSQGGPGMNTPEPARSLETALVAALRTYPSK